MFRELFRQMGTGFTVMWCVTAAFSLAFMGVGLYILILLASYLSHHL